MRVSKIGKRGRSGLSGGVDFFSGMIRHDCQYNFSGFRSLRRQFLANLKSGVVKVERDTRPLNGFLINRAALNVLEG